MTCSIADVTNLTTMRNIFCFVISVTLFANFFDLHAQCIDSGTLVSAAGTTVQGYNGDGGLASTAKINQPLGITGDANGNLYFADGLNHIIRKVAPDGIISTIAGVPGVSGFNQANGFSSTTTLDYPNDVAIDDNGMLYVTEGITSLIRKIDPIAQTTTLIGGMPVGGFGNAGDGGPALSAQFMFPNGIAVSSAGEVFIADRFNNKIRKIDTSGIVTTVVGTGVSGYSGDGGSALQATLSQPISGEMDSNDNFYFIDLQNHCVRKFDTTTGTITTVAGNGTAGYAGDDGAATAAQLNNPQGLAIDADDNIFISDAQNARIRRVDATTGIITTVMGNGSQGYPTEGHNANSASINPYSLFVSAEQNIYYSEWINHRILKLDCPPEVTFYEAECTTVGSNWIVSNHPSASNGTSVLYPGVGKKLVNPPTDNNDIVRFWVVVSEAGDYNIFTRTLAHNTFNDDLWVSINSGTWIEFSNLEKSLAFKWNQLHDGDINNPIAVPLVQGINTIDIGVGEDGIRIDKISVARSAQQPTGLGGVAGNCTSSVSEDDVETFGLEPEESIAELEAYPSPFIETINLKLGSIGFNDVKVVNAIGQVIWERRKLEFGEYNINLQNAPAGIYFIHVENNEKRKVLKVQKI